MLFPDLKLQLETASGACVLFDSATMRHSTEECAPSGPGQAARMGVALHCKKDVSGGHAVHMHQSLRILHICWYGQVGSASLSACCANAGRPILYYVLLTYVCIIVALKCDLTCRCLHWQMRTSSS